MAENKTFWEHLDELKTYIVRILVVILVLAIAAFVFKEAIFSAVLAPQNADFVTYRLLNFSKMFPSGDPFSVQIINTGLAEQFIIHMRVAFYVGLLCASPYMIYSLFRFVTPALYDRERHAAAKLVVSGYLLFIAGVVLCYFLIFPLTFRFLATYQVSESVRNLISLNSYISTMLTMTFVMGAVFEIPVLCSILGRMGLLSSELMKRYRRHAIVIIVLIGAIITPTGDPFTLTVVSLPMWLLYEAGIASVKRMERRRKTADA